MAKAIGGVNTGRRGKDRNVFNRLNSWLIKENKYVAGCRMDLIIAGLFFVVAAFFYVAGGYLRNLLWVFIGGAAFLLLGIGVFATSVSYQDFNTTTTNFTFSSNYFEFANDTVVCTNCTNVTYSNASNSTPPTCCAHDVNTTISGSVSQDVQLQKYTVEVSMNERLMLGFFFTLIGFATIIEMAVVWDRERKENKKRGG